MFVDDTPTVNVPDKVEFPVTFRDVRELKVDDPVTVSPPLIVNEAFFVDVPTVTFPYKLLATFVAVSLPVEIPTVSAPLSVDVPDTISVPLRVEVPDTVKVPVDVIPGAVVGQKNFVGFAPAMCVSTSR